MTTKKDASQKTQSPIKLPDEKAGFETQLAALEEIVDLLEQSDVELEVSLALFEQGVTLQRRCQQQLSSAEKRVEVLTQENNELVSEWLEETA